MSIGFFIVGGVLFATYMGFTIWNIIYSNRKQREENYPNLPHQNNITDVEGMDNFTRTPANSSVKTRRIKLSRKEEDQM